jgi:c-di-GMP-binding flagellar brake protein YcgR
MLKEKEIPLKVEVFPQGEDRNFLILNPGEIKHILQTVCERKARCALYYDNGKRFFLTVLLAVNDKGIWIDPALDARDNQHITNSDEIVFVSSHNRTKIQFVTGEVFQSANINNNAIFLPLPQHLLRLQRREFYRLETGARNPVKCVIRPVEHLRHIRHELAVADISLGGLALVSREQELELKPGNIYQNCEIELPEVGTVTTTLQVKNTFDVPGRNGKMNRRAGCEFVKPGRETTMPLQRYVAQMQLKAAAARI